MEFIIVQSTQHQFTLVVIRDTMHFLKQLVSNLVVLRFSYLECGHYNNTWKYIHMTPEETVQASIDLTGKSADTSTVKFSLTLHRWMNR
ncbi:MAG: hypothetical protein IPI65_14450 [Bacteroidetes bacterium]|nr:hypothetical protein [Bacteroidota bacterium]